MQRKDGNMNNSYQHILVIQTKGMEDHALARAVSIAQQSNAAITVFQSCYQYLKHANNTSDDLTEFVVNQERKLCLQINEYICDDFPLMLNLKISWQLSLVPAIKSVLNDPTIDLIIKPCAESHGVFDFFTNALDRFLIDECDLPVWIAKSYPEQHQHTVLACLDIEDESGLNEHLNEVILSAGDKASAALSAELHLIDCYYGETCSMRMDFDSEPNPGFADVRQQHHVKIQPYLEEHHLVDEKVHLHEGMPDDEIPKLAYELDADLTILGNHQRAGFLHFLWGGSNQYITRQLANDVLVVKVHQD